MKNLLLAASMLVAFSANALTSSDSWSTIKSSHSVEVAMPSVMLDNGGAAAADFMCVAGDVLRTIKKVKTCNKWSRNRNNDRCVGYKHYYGIAKIETTKTKCVEWSRSRNNDRCVRYETYAYTVPTSYDVAVYKVHPRSDRREKKLFTKTLTIADCE